MISVIDTALELEAFCKQQGWQYCFIGGIALQRWGEMRFTADVDLTLLTGFTNESMYMDALITHFMPRIPDIKEFALQTRVLLLKAANGVGIDIALGALPFEERTIERATLFEIATKKYIRLCPEST